MNIKHGYGELTLRDGTVYKGNFVDNHAQGNFRVSFCNGDVFNGNVKKGIFHGEGELRESDGQIYKGMFMNGVKHGQGTYYISPEIGGTFILNEEFYTGEPKTEGNHL